MNEPLVHRPKLPLSWRVAAGTIVIAGCWLLCIATPAYAAFAHAKSGGWWCKPTVSDHESWVLTTPTAADTITWSAGVNEVDFTRFGPAGWPAEPYFTCAPPALPAPRTFTGFGWTVGGPPGSVANSMGGGSSIRWTNTVTLTVGGVPKAAGTWMTYSANWTLNATGALGSPIPPARNWEAKARASDPWHIWLDDLDAADIVLGESIDLMVPFELAEGEYSENGGIGFDIYLDLYDPVNGPTSTKILGISLGGEEPDSVTSAFDGTENLDVFTVVETPPEDPEDPEDTGTLDLFEADFEDIRAQILADAGDGMIDNPANFSLAITNIPYPYYALPDGIGEVARIRYEGRAEDSASIPEPATGLLLAVAAAPMIVRRRRAWL
ncbi:MAG: hypothetical protein JXQ75_13255 [Phycisphaerae bacterium]|nr:hypothetical protein [Phycisphaerae bacterium]